MLVSVEVGMCWALLSLVGSDMLKLAVVVKVDREGACLNAVSEESKRSTRARDSPWTTLQM